MTKKIIVFVVAILVINTGVLASDMLQSNSKMIISGKEEAFENNIYNEDGKLYVPLREFCDKMNIPVIWDEKNKCANVEAIGNDERSNATEEKNIVPDKETAISIARIILEKYMGRKIENNMYKLTANEYPDGDIWRVYLDYSKEANIQQVHTPLICLFLSSKTGAVKYISTYTTLDIDENFGDDEVRDFYGNIRKKPDISVFDFTGDITYTDMKSLIGYPDCAVYQNETEEYYQGYTLADDRKVLFDYDYFGDNKITRMWVGTDATGYKELDISKNIAAQLR